MCSISRNITYLTPSPSVLSTEKKRIMLSRFRSRCDSLSATEMSQLKRTHRGFQKTIPGKLDHASIAAVHLHRMNRLDNFGVMSTPGISIQSTLSSFGGGSLTRSNESRDNGTHDRNVRRLSRTIAPNKQELRYQYQRKF